MNSMICSYVHLLFATALQERKVAEFNEHRFCVAVGQTKIGGTTYEVSTHFNHKGRENVLQQFEDLLTELKTA